MSSWEAEGGGNEVRCCSKGGGGGGEEWGRRRRRRDRRWYDLTHQARSQLWVTSLVFLVLLIQHTGVVEGEARYLSHYPAPNDLPPSPLPPAPTAPPRHDADVKIPGRYFPKLPYLRPYLEQPPDPHYNHHHRDDPTTPYYHRHHFPQQLHHLNHTNYHQQPSQHHQHHHTSHRLQPHPHHHSHQQQPLHSHLDSLHLQPHRQPQHGGQYHNHNHDHTHDYNHQPRHYKGEDDDEEEERVVEPLSLPSLYNQNHNHHHRDTDDYPQRRKSGKESQRGKGGGEIYRKQGTTEEEEEEGEEGGVLFRVSEEEGGRRRIIAVKGGRGRKDDNFHRDDSPNSSDDHQPQNPNQYYNHDPRDRGGHNPGQGDPTQAIDPLRPAPPYPDPAGEELPAQDAANMGPPPGPSFDRNLPRNITIQAGQTAVLSCRVFNVNDKSVSWIRQENLHILTVDKYKYSTDQRVSVVFNEPNLEWVLRIRGVTPEDAGQYECQVSTKPVLSFVVNMSIVEVMPTPPPTPTPESPMSDEEQGEDQSHTVPRAWVLNAPEIHVHRGSPINLTCIVSHGTERPVFIYWYHHDKVLDYEGRGGVRVETVTGRDTVSHLLVERAGPGDAGRYTCSPSNGVDASINLHVLNGEYQAAMQTNGGSQVGKRRGMPALLLPLLLPTFLLTSS